MFALLRRFVVAATAAVLIAAPAWAQERHVYQLPQEARPHDVAPAPDGNVWYTAQRNGALGILDPKTGEVREVADGTDSLP